MTTKLVFSWILGATLFTFAVFIITKSESIKMFIELSEFFVYLIGFIFILLAGLLWINVGTEVARH
ncbi:MAG: hypothetical protein QW051_04760 [Candidatus Aenigmatarchaeota archaeon]